MNEEAATNRTKPLQLTVISGMLPETSRILTEKVISNHLNHKLFLSTEHSKYPIHQMLPLLIQQMFIDCLLYTDTVPGSEV